MGFLGGVDFTKCKHRFVVQLHKAERAGTHYDLRLEAYDNDAQKCVLVSWATRKLNKLISNEAKRINVYRTENHDLEWLSFAGEIPEGYGKGVVRIFDKGTYSVYEEKKDVLVVDFFGKILTGSYAFVKMSSSQFLLVKVGVQEEINMSAGIYPYAGLLYKPYTRQLQRKRGYRNEIDSW